MLTLYFEAPFAAFRTFTAGSFRPTASFVTPSAAYGLLLNVAGIEMRHDDRRSVMTLIRDDLPQLSVAIAVAARDGSPVFPEQHSILQQLHNYPVGATGKERAAEAKGNKYNIVPVRRSFLSGLRGYLAANGNPELEKQIVDGLQGSRPRAYGIPFLGDNNFLLDRLRVVEESPCDAYWYVRIGVGTVAGMPDAVTRMTISIDRADMSKTVSALFEPQLRPSPLVPETAWVRLGRAE
jgi:CRISPR-associated protein Cas5t